MDILAFAMPNRNEISDLKKRRGIVKASCKHIKTFVESITDITPAIISQVEERKIKLDEQWHEYNNFQVQLELFDETEANDRIAFEENFYTLSAKIRDIVKANSNNVMAASSSSSNSSGTQSNASLLNVRLPKLDLPKFSEKYDE